MFSGKIPSSSVEPPPYPICCLNSSLYEQTRACEFVSTANLRFPISNFRFEIILITSEFSFTPAIAY